MKAEAAHHTDSKHAHKEFREKCGIIVAHTHGLILRQGGQAPSLTRLLPNPLAELAAHRACLTRLLPNPLAELAAHRACLSLTRRRRSVAPPNCTQPALPRESAERAPILLANHSHIPFTDMSKSADIVPLLAKHLDPHLAIKMLQFLREGGHRSSEQVLAAEMRILDKTNLVDLMADRWKLVPKNKDAVPPADLEKRRKTVLDEMQRLTEICRPLLDVLSNEKKVQQMQEEKVLTNVELRDKHKVPSEAIENLYRYCKCLYECGQYHDAHRYLQFVRVLGGVTQAEDESAMWGILAAAICGGAEGAKLRAAFKTVRDKIDQKAQISLGTAGPRGRCILQERAWLLHWSLFVFFDSEEGLDEMTDLMMQEPYMQVLQTAAPHLLRYFSVAVLLNTTPRKRQLLERLEQLLAQEQNYYSDSVTEFINAVTVRFDFDSASDRLAECETVIRGDVFLQRWLDDFMEMARLLVFKTYCLIHKNIEIKALSLRLRMDEQQAERWIGRSIRAHRLDARIDSSNNTIVMGDVNESVYKIVLEKTRTLTVKTIGAIGQVQRQGFSVNASKSYNPRQSGGRAGPN